MLAKSQGKKNSREERRLAHALVSEQQDRERDFFFFILHFFYGVVARAKCAKRSIVLG